MTWREQYKKAYLDWQLQQGYTSPKEDWPRCEYPPISKANGLTKAIEKFLNWNGHRATRINVQGQLIKAPERQESGNIITVNKFRPSSTRKGTADISATINGRSVMLEVKIGKDKPSSYQLAEQARERKAGGIYEFIHTIEEFFEWYNMNVEIWR